MHNISSQYWNYTQQTVSQRQNYVENKDEKISGMKASINATYIAANIPACMTIQDIQQPTENNILLQDHRPYIIYGWPSNRVDVK